MSRFYAELHDRELLAQAETILAEVQRRSLIEVFLPAADASSQEAEAGTVFPRRLTSIFVAGGKLRMLVENNFFRSNSAQATGSGTK